MTFSPKKYVKDESFDPFYTYVNKDFFYLSRVVPVLFVSLGILVFTSQIIWPLIVFNSSSITPKSATQTLLGFVSGFSEFEFSELSNANQQFFQDDTILGTNSSRIPLLEIPFYSSNSQIIGPNEFEELPTQNSATPEFKIANIPDFFYLTIPKLGIYEAVVETNSPNLNPDEFLGHYPSSELPGTPGTTFIYGHSVLPIFFNPKNYKTIFSTLDKLEVGDTFSLNYNNKEFKYEVEAAKVLNVDEVKPLVDIKPKYLNENTVVLMTCWPFGTTLKRYVVHATLIN